MAKVSKETASRGDDYGAVYDRAEEIEGYTINFVSFRQDIDATPLYRGLPDDRCQCPHWGYVLRGRITTIDTRGRQETVEANDLFYWPPGHNVRVDEDAEIVMFSPQREHIHVIDHMRKKINAA